VKEVNHGFSFVRLSGALYHYVLSLDKQLKGSVKEPNMFHNYENEKINRKASDETEYIELFGSSARDRHARRI